MKRWFARVMAYMEDEVHNDAAQVVGLFSYYEANFFHAKTLAEALDMREEDLSLTFGLACYASDRSRTALAEERYRELADKAHRYSDFDMENRAYRQLATLTKDSESKRAWTQKAADMWSGAEKLSAEAYYTLGRNAFQEGDLFAAEEYSKQALSIWEREEDSRAVSLYGLLGNFAGQRGDTETAKEWYQKQWRKAKAVGYLPSQGNASRALGRIAAERGDAMEALERYQEALGIYQALQKPERIALTLNDMGELFIDVGAYDAAKDALIQSVKIAERIGAVQLAAMNYNALGRLSVMQSDFVSAKLWFEKALSMLESLRDEKNAAIARGNLERVTAKINGGK